MQPFWKIALAAVAAQADARPPNAIETDVLAALAVTLDDRTNLRDAVLRGLDQTIRDAKTKGAAQAFGEVTAQGYTQEIAIPWKLLVKDGQAAPKA